MVKTKNVEVELSTGEQNRCLDGIDINNSCRQVYLRRMESIEECKRSTTPVFTDKQTTMGTSLARLRMEMVRLMDQDAGLMRQMLILNEKVEELKANNFCQMSKESINSQDSLYYTDDQTDEILSDEDTFEFSQYTENDSDYTDSDEDSCNDITPTQKCLCSPEESNDSDYLDNVFDKLLEFDAM